MKNFRIFFQCKPGNHWRACSDVVQAANSNLAILAVKLKDYQMPVRGDYSAAETTDIPATCWMAGNKPEPLPAFKVTCNDGRSYVTSMAAGITLEAARKYFIGAVFTDEDIETDKEHHWTATDVQPA